VLVLQQKNSIESIFLLCSLCTKEDHFNPMCATTTLLFLQKLIVNPCNVSRPPTCPICGFEFAFLGKK